MQIEIDENLEWTAKILAAMTAIWAFIWKIGCPCARWVRRQLQIGSRVEQIFLALDDIRGSIWTLTARAQLSFENSPIPSYECDKHGDCIAVNPAWCKLFGVSEHHMLGNGWLDVIENEDRERVMENWRNSITNRLPHRESYRAVNRQTGAIIQCESSTVSFADSSGNPTIYFGTISLKP